MAKTLQVSTDGTTYYTLPGSTGDINYESSAADDTVFGAGGYSSSQPTLITWSLSANAFYKGLAGYVATFNKTGSSTTLTDEPMTLVSGNTYKITDTAKNILNRAVTITTKDNTVDSSADIQSIDHLFGQITFSSAQTGPVTLSGAYLVQESVGTAKEFSLTMNAESIDTTDFATASANGGFQTSTPGLRTVSIDASGFFNTSNDFKTLLVNRSELIIEINPDGSDLSAARGYVRATTTGQSGDAGGNEQEDITFELSVPDDANVPLPFKWLHDSSTTLSTAVQKVLSTWEDQTQPLLYVKYLHDGTSGWSGTGVITDTSLSGSVDGINEFSISISGSGAPTNI